MGAQGNTTVDFGSGHQTHKILTITSEAGIVADSAVEAWIRAEASADHSADEHMIENILCRAGKIVAGTGFEIDLTCFMGTTYGVWNVSWVWN